MQQTMPDGSEWIDFETDPVSNFPGLVRVSYAISGRQFWTDCKACGSTITDGYLCLADSLADEESRRGEMLCHPCFWKEESSHLCRAVR